MVAPAPDGGAAAALGALAAGAGALAGAAQRSTHPTHEGARKSGIGQKFVKCCFSDLY